MHKREVYADFLTAAQAAAEAESNDALGEFRAQANRVRVTAGRDLRELLKPYLKDVEAITTEPLLTEIIEEMGEDIRKGEPAS